MRAPSESGSGIPRGKPSPWVWPLAIALLLAAYHVWDLAFRHRGTGLRVSLVSMEQAKAALARDPRAMAIDVRLHGENEPLPRIRRVPYMQLDSRMRELEPYRRTRLFIIAASEEQGISAAVVLTRRRFSRVSVVRATPTARARASTPGQAGRALTSSDGLISLNENPGSH